MSKLNLLYILYFHTAYSIHICGNYCGPDFCNGIILSESDCDEHVLPEEWSAFGPSCADSCCRQHDRCCRGDHSTIECNHIIISCLKTCNPFSLTCTRDSIPVIPSAIEIAMEIVENWCCGEPCVNTTKKILL